MENKNILGYVLLFFLCMQSLIKSTNLLILHNPSENWINFINIIFILYWIIFGIVSGILHKTIDKQRQNLPDKEKRKRYRVFSDFILAVFIFNIFFNINLDYPFFIKPFIVIITVFISVIAFLYALTRLPVLGKEQQLIISYIVRNFSILLGTMTVAYQLDKPLLNFTFLLVLFYQLFSSAFFIECFKISFDNRIINSFFRWIEKYI